MIFTYTYIFSFSDNNVITNFLETIKSAGNGQENQSIFKIKSASSSKSDSAKFVPNAVVSKKDNVSIPLSTSLSSPNLCISYEMSSSSATTLPETESDTDDLLDLILPTNSNPSQINITRLPNNPTLRAIPSNASSNRSFNILDCSSNDENDVEEEIISGENDVEYIELSMSQRMPQDQITNTSATEYVSLDDEFMLLSMFDDSPSNSFAVQDNNSTATSCEYSTFIMYLIHCKIFIYRL